MNPEHDIYTCPMHEEVEKTEPGMCPLCGMQLVKGTKKEHGKESQPHDKHAGHDTSMLLRKFVVSLFLAVPLVVYSEFPKVLFGFEAPAFPGSSFLGIVLGTVIFFYGGMLFLRGALRELRARLPGMMTLIALAISTAYIWSMTQSIQGKTETLFFELATLITIMLLGHWIEMKSVQRAKGALQELSALLPDTAEVVQGGATKQVALGDLRKGDVVLVRPGARVPADGVVLEGVSEVNEALVTGESRPEKKSKGSEVIAGTINGSGSLRVSVEKLGEHTFLAGIMRLVAEAEASKSRLQMLSDKAAYLLTIAAVSLGTLTFLVWVVVQGNFPFAVTRLVAVLVIACPHALGLAIPLVASISLTMAAKNGFLVRQRLALEAARNITLVLFDKTGTLTTGQFGVERIIAGAMTSEQEVLATAAAIESHAEHFLGKAIVAKARENNIAFSPAEDFSYETGRFVKGIVAQKEYMLGGDGMLEDLGIALPVPFAKRIQEAQSQGKSAVFLVEGSTVQAAFLLGDIVRAESYEAIASLRKLGLRIGMITGDSEEVAAFVAKELGIDEYFASVLPAKKVEKVQALQGQGYKVAMVGDGINDAPALSQADVGIAIGAGTNVAIESAGIILVKNDPRDIAKIIRLSRMTWRKMVQNLFWATGYNVVALPLAAGVLAFQGIFLQPALAALFMSASTVIVAINAMLLRRSRLA